MAGEKREQKSNKTWIRVLVVVTTISLGIGGYLLLSPGQSEKYTGPLEEISIGATTQELSTLIWIAEEKDYFKENGLDATVKAYDTGIETKNALLAGEVDVADTVDFVICGLVLEGADVKVLASINTGFIDYITAQKDKGITNVSDLKGKKIGIKLGSSAEYYLGRTLLFNNLSLQDVELIPMHPPDMSKAIARDEIDAAIAWHPHNYHIKNGLGDNAIVWPAQGGQEIYWVVFSENEFVKKYPERIKRFLKALIQAEEFVLNNDLESKNIIARRVSLGLKYVKSVWSDFHFIVDLSQSMIIAMEDQARWKMENNLTEKTEVPNYLNYIYSDTLEEIKPEAVTIIK